jgi:hypothetical protein
MRRWGWRAIQPGAERASGKRPGADRRYPSGECDGNGAFHHHDSSGDHVGELTARGVRFIRNAIDRDYAGFRQRIGVYGRLGVNRK